MQANIKEIFESVQGEGIFVGEKQIFVRFAGCNLQCAYCDTDYYIDKSTLVLKEEELFDKLRKYNSEIISFTGGEPLMSVDFLDSFLSKYKKYLNKKIYLETNGTLFEELEKIIENVDIIAMDIKIQSATNQINQFDINEKFLDIAYKKDVFLNTVFTSLITDDEIDSIINLVSKYNVPLVLQPRTPFREDEPFMEIYNKFYDRYPSTLLIPQTHKFLNLR